MFEQESNDEFNWLEEIVPTFYVDGSNVQVISDPHAFYTTLKELISNAKHRIILSSLYLGVGNLEKELVDCLHKALQNSPDGSLQLQVLLDYSRGTRGEPSSCSMLSPLIGQFHDRVRVFLFHTPLLRGFLKRVLPDRWKEIIGVQHMKLYIFDDNLLISGANLSDHYFTHRQDRYVLIRRCSSLTDFYEDVVDAVGRCSFYLNASGELDLHKDCTEHPFEDDFQNFCTLMKDRLDFVVEKWRKRNNIEIETRLDTTIYPLLQMGPIGVDTEDTVIKDILSGNHMMEDRAHVALASGYFNLTSSYMDIILNRSDVEFKILMSSPKANGFHNATGLSQFIPPVYTNIARKFFRTIVGTGQAKRICLYEYDKDSWTFHAKGIWLSKNNDTSPFCTLVGSTNYGQRSVNRDLETQIVVVTRNAALKSQLKEEQERLFSCSSLIDANVFRRPDHHVPLWVRFVTRFVKNFF